MLPKTQQLHPPEPEEGELVDGEPVEGGPVRGLLLNGAAFCCITPFYHKSLLRSWLTRAGLALPFVAFIT